MALCFPALLSHCRRPHASVRDTLSADLEHALRRPRLTGQASLELSILNSYILDVHLRDTLDVRRIRLPSSPLFSSQAAYQALHAADGELQGPKLIWGSRLPGKIKFFGWLMHFDRLNSRANLYGKNIRSLEESFCPACAGVLKTGDHIFTSCPRALEVWGRLNFHVSEGQQREPWQIGHPPHLPSIVSLDMVLIILWHIWKLRNALIFDSKNITTDGVLRQAAKTWTFGPAASKDTKSSSTVGGILF